MDKTLSDLCRERVPRYTSYPTAPHFKPDVGPQTYAQWLEALQDDTPLSLYLHVPFCTALCHYCGCHTKVVNKPEVIASYGDLLIREIRLVRERIGHALPVTHIHWGGGTPSLMPAETFRAIAGEIRDAFNSRPGMEHAIELDPRTVDAALSERLAEVGINRASLGVQDFSPHVQELIGRRQPYGVVAAAVSNLRNAGITAVNFDLMYGLAGQTTRDVRRTATLAIELNPSRIALFGYAHVPWFRKNQQLIDESQLPKSRERFNQAEEAAEVLTKAGYVRIGIDHFARPDDPMAIAAGAGALARNFQGYTTDSADVLLGFGASSIGRLPQGHVQNTPDMMKYRQAIEAGDFATVRGLRFAPEDRARGAIIERLMCDFSVDLDRIAHDLHCSDRMVQPKRDRLDDLCNRGLAEFDGHVLKMTDRGRPFVRLAAAAFDTYLEADHARHSEAV
ncbi:MAG: oxygen-independent coproporphyrinogen III oxidase [Rhodobiaceae bacterium]|nr:oxygen-independent coproporphyrinogen III oxidase [Rhodobiaceae bacterium]